jgi:putative peptidoglycan lipid II flippase
MPDPAPRLARSAGVLGLATLASRVLGLIRDQVLAYYFGAGDAMDAFRVAFRVPNLLRDLFAEGAMSAAFVPTFTGYLARDGRDRAWRLANSVLNSLLLTTVACVAIGYALAPALVRLFAADFGAVAGKLELTILLARIVLPFLTMVAVAAVLMGMLNALGHFFVPALSPATFNLASIVLVIALVPASSTLGVQPIVIVALATVVGGVAQVVIQWPPLVSEGFRYKPSLDVADAGLRRVLLLMGPGTVGLAATQINVFVNTVLATGQGTGAVSWLDYAFRLMYLPIGLFGVSVATASTPAIARLVATGQMGQIRATLAHAISLMMLLNVPSTVG